MVNTTSAGARLLKFIAGATLLCAIWTFLPLLQVIAEPLVTLWHVSAAGVNASGCGGSLNPCRTISHILPGIAAGDQIIVTGAITDNFTLSKDVTITGAANASIDGTGARIIKVNGGANVVINNITLRNGGGNQNGGLIHNAGGVVINNSLLAQSTVDGANGGAIYNTGAATIISSTLSNNVARYGGAIENQGTLVISASMISSNSAESGGGIDNASGGVVHLMRSVVISNAALSAAGIYNDLAISAQMWITDTAVVSNTGSDFAGGIFNGGLLSLVNSTVSNNHLRSGPGAGIDHQSGSLFMQSVTIAGNTVANATGSSAVNFAGSGIMRNSVIANNGLTNCSGNITSSGYNHSSDSSCGYFDQPTDVKNVGAQLGPLQLTALPYTTYTNAPLRDSPLINRILAAACGSARDQRGVERPQGPGCDVGAHEAMPVELELSAVSTPAALPAGAPLAVLLTAANAGPGIATGIVVTSDLPSGVVFQNCDGALTCVASSGRLTVTMSALTTGANITATVRLIPQQIGDISVRFHVLADQWETQWANNMASINATVFKSADISVLMDGMPTVPANATFSIAVSVANNGLFPADAPTFTLMLPANVTFVHADVTNWACDLAAGVVSCAAQSPLQARETHTLIIMLQSGGAPAVLQLVSNATSSTFDPDISNNTMSFPVTIGPGSRILLPIVLRQ